MSLLASPVQSVTFLTDCNLSGGSTIRKLVTPDIIELQSTVVSLQLSLFAGRF